MFPRPGWTGRALLGLALAASSATAEIQTGAASCGRNARIRFPRPFKQVPVVVASATGGNGAPVIAWVHNIRKEFFQVFFHGREEGKRPDRVHVQWVAATREPGVAVGSAKYVHRARIMFPEPMPDAVVLSAGGGPRAVGVKHTRVRTWASRVTDAAFTLHITPRREPPATPVMWIAVVPRPAWRCARVRAADGTALELAPGRPIVFPTVPGERSRLAAIAQPGTEGARFAIRDAEGTPSGPVAVHTWALPEGVVSEAGPPELPEPLGLPTGSLVQAGTGEHTDGATVPFRWPFPSPPAMVAVGRLPDNSVEMETSSSYFRERPLYRPVLAAATDVTPEGFRVLLRQPDGRPLGGPAQVHWIAALPHGHVVAGRVLCTHHQPVALPRPGPDKAWLLVLNAVERDHPCWAAPANPFRVCGAWPHGFVPAITRGDGRPAGEAELHFILLPNHPWWVLHRGTADSKPIPPRSPLPAPDIAVLRRLTTEEHRALTAEDLPPSGLAVTANALSAGAQTARPSVAWVHPWRRRSLWRRTVHTRATPPPDIRDKRMKHRVVVLPTGFAPVAEPPPACELALGEGGRSLTSSTSIFVEPRLQGHPMYDPDADGVLQTFEDAVMRRCNPRFVLDEEEDWLLPKHQRAHHAVNFVRVTPWPSRAQPRYLLINYCVTWSRDYGRFAGDLPKALRKIAQRFTYEHDGEVEQVILAWRLLDPEGTSLRLERVFTSSHEKQTLHSGSWSAWKRSTVTGKTVAVAVRVDGDLASLDDLRKDPESLRDLEVEFLPSVADDMTAELEFDSDGVVRLYPSEDKHAIYPTAAVGDAVRLVWFGGDAAVGEDCGGGPTRRFFCYNAGEPEPGDPLPERLPADQQQLGRHLIADLDEPDSWRALSDDQRRALTGLFPREHVWNGNKDVWLITTDPRVRTYLHKWVEAWKAEHADSQAAQWGRSLRRWVSRVRDKAVPPALRGQLGRLWADAKDRLAERLSDGATDPVLPAWLQEVLEIDAPARTFCGGLGILDWTHSPCHIGGKLADLQREKLLDKLP